MNLFKGLYMGAAIACGVAAEVCGVTDKVLEGGHYVAEGLRKTADGIDYVTDVCQDYARAGEAACNHSKESWMEIKENAADSTKEEFELIKSNIEAIIAEMEEEEKREAELKAGEKEKNKDYIVGEVISC